MAVIIACSNLIGQYLVLLFISTFGWFIESISQIFLKLESLFKAKLNVRAKTIQFILNLDSWQKINKKIDLSAILDFDAAIKLKYKDKLGDRMIKQ